MKRKLLIVGVALVLILGLVGVYLYSALYVPMSRLRDLHWVTTATPQEQRETCHRLLSSRFSGLIDLHDAIGMLGRVGNEKSVPLLIRVLPRKNGPHVCTWAHCKEVLCRLTGEPAEDWTFEDWHRWWETEGRAKYEGR